MNNRYNTLTKNTGIFAIANLAARLINLLLLPLYTNILTTSEYGQAEIIYNGANLIMPFVSLSISDAFLRFGLERDVETRAVLKTTSRVLLISSVVLLIVHPFFSVYPGIGNYAFLFSILCISQMVRNTYCLYAKINDRNDIFGYDTVVYTFSLGISNVVLLFFLQLGVTGYLSAYIFANLSSILFLVIKLSIVSDIKDGRFDRLLLIQMLKYSIPMIANAISWWILQFSDRLMIEYYLSNKEVGIYSAAAKIPNILSMVVGVFSQAWMLSSISEYEKADSSAFYSNVFKVYLLVLTFCSLVLIIIVRPMMNILVGKDFSSSWYYVPFLIVGAFFGSISSFAAPFFSAAKKNVTITITTIIAALVNITINAFLIPLFGIMGAVVSTMVAYFVVGMIRIYKSRSYVSFNLPHMKLWISSAMTVIASIITLLQDKIATLGYVEVVFGICMVFVVMYGREAKLLLLRIREAINEKI